MVLRRQKKQHLYLVFIRFHIILNSPTPHVIIFLLIKIVCTKYLSY